ncbi:hypothetical protein [Klebsiella pneumoniae]|uniref:hypothetical protein n=1 Tax=Klebsiella pneumoniae TaxID=573 RepID=UPI001C80AE49|nr:hypothetical protein [Klebsiella pneumoniae]
MHYAQQYIKENVLPGQVSPNVAITHVLNGNTSLELDRCLKNDGINYLYSALISYAEAVKGIQTGFYSWATVKLYYSAFYSLRSVLSSDGICIFYLGTKGYTLFVRQGESPEKADGTTHKLVMKLFKKKYPLSPFVNQQIDMVEAFDWLMEQRETANYKNGRFSEPDVPVIYERCNIGLQRLLTAYIQDVDYNYCFDHEHAILSLPLEIIKEASSSVIQKTTFRFNNNDIAYLKKLLRVGGQPVTSFQELIERMR